MSPWILVATLLSVGPGCAPVADAPQRALSTEPQSPPEKPTENLSLDPSQSGASSPLMPWASIIPSAPEMPEEPPPAILPAPTPRLVEIGFATWYGSRHHGKRTASGELFDQNKFTAAHPTLPWGSVVKVTNLANSKSVEVRINDRGPFGKGRIIDVSRAAAKALGMLRTGLARVKIEWLSPHESVNGPASDHQ